MTREHVCTWCEEPLDPPFVYLGKLNAELHQKCAVDIGLKITEQVMQIREPNISGFLTYGHPIMCPTPLCGERDIRVISAGMLKHGSDPTVAHILFSCPVHVFTFEATQEGSHSRLVARRISSKEEPSLEKE
jgi:hypothetical protein